MTTGDFRKYKAIGSAAVFIRHTLDGEEALHVYGEVDMAREGDLREAIEDVARGNKPILIDLTCCTYMDSRAFHVLQKANTKWRLRVLVAAGSAVQRIFEILRASEFMNITYRDVTRLEPRNEAKKKATS